MDDDKTVGDQLVMAEERAGEAANEPVAETMPEMVDAAPAMREAPEGSPMAMFETQEHRDSAVARIAAIAHAVLEAEGHGWEVLQGNARQNIADEVERQMYDPRAPHPAGWGDLVRAVISSAAPILREIDAPK